MMRIVSPEPQCRSAYGVNLYVPVVLTGAPSEVDQITHTDYPGTQLDDESKT